MAVELSGGLPAIDHTTLTTVVRTALDDPALEVLAWTIEPLGHAKIIATTGGLFLVRGTARSTTDTPPWSVVLKVVHNPKQWGQEPRGWAYWKRELLVYQSGLLAELPGAIGAPRCYGVSEDADGGRIWMEHVDASGARRWLVEEYRRAARQAGRFAGAFLSGVPVPKQPWLAETLYRSALVDGDFWATYMHPESARNAWQHPLVQGAFSGELRAAVLRIWAEKTRFWAALDRLPQVLCHSDFHRRNLLWRADPNGDEELIAVDWAFSGPGALGTDLGQLSAISGYFCELAPEELPEVETVALAAYLAGLHDARWDGDPRLVRLGALLAAVLWMGATLPGWAGLMLPPEAGVNVEATYGYPADAVLNRWVRLTELLVKRAEEARSLIAELGMG